MLEADALKGYSYRRFGETSYHPCLPGDIANLFSDAADSILVRSKSAEQSYQLLSSEWTNDRSLHLILILLDSNSHLRAKRIATVCIEEFLSREAVADFLAYRLYSRTLPEVANITEALQMSAEDGCRVLYGFLAELQKRQTQIAEVREQWDLLDPAVFNGADEKRRFEHLVINEGVFYHLSVGRQRGFNLDRWQNNPRLKQFDQWELVLTAWSRPFLAKKPGREIQGSLFGTREAGDGLSQEWRTRP
jgi:hypothetical protein